MKRILLSLFACAMALSAMAQAPENSKLALSFTLGDEVEIGKIYGFTINTTANKLWVDAGGGILERSNKEPNGLGLFYLDFTVSSKDIKVYLENPDDIKELRIKFLNEVDLSNCTQLTELTCYKNSLTKLDLSKNTKLTDIDCDESLLEELDLSTNTLLTTLYWQRGKLKKLNISNCTQLIELNCRNNDLQELNLSNNTKLTLLNCDKSQLKELDLTKNTSLANLNCDSNQLNELDLTNNTELTRLNCYENLLEALDIKNNTKLTNLNCSSNHLKELDLTKNTKLTFLSCGSNQLKELNINNNDLLTTLYCDKNQLKELETNNNTLLTRLDCHNNQLLFSSLTDSEINTYHYSPQKEVQIETTYSIKKAIDLSHTGATEYVWKKAEDTPLEAGTDYTVTDGVTIFHKIYDDVYCEMKNPKFPDLTLTTTKTTITNIQRGLSFTIGNSIEIGEEYGFTINTTANKLWVDAGGEILERSNKEPNGLGLFYLNFTVSSKDIKVYIENPDDIETIDIQHISKIDLSNCTKLTELICSENELTELDLSKNTELTVLNCSTSYLSKPDLTNNVKLTRLAWSGQLTELNISACTLLTSLDCSLNQLKELDLTQNTRLTELSCHSNQLKELDLTQNTLLTYLDCHNNQLLFSSLTDREIRSYYYSPQENVQIETAYPTGISIDLSHTGATEYVWKKADDKSIVNEDEYTIIDGVTTFSSIMEAVYCEMKNPKFPDLTLTTTKTTITTGTSINELQSTVKVEGQEGAISIESDAPLQYTIYTTTGTAIAMGTTDGESIVSASRGIYIVKLAGDSHKVIVR